MLVSTEGDIARGRNAFWNGVDREAACKVYLVDPNPAQIGGGKIRPNPRARARLRLAALLGPPVRRRMPLPLSSSGQTVAPEAKGRSKGDVFTFRAILSSRPSHLDNSLGRLSRPGTLKTTRWRACVSPIGTSLSSQTQLSMPQGGSVRSINSRMPSMPSFTFVLW